MIRINRPEFLSAMLCAAANDVRYYLNGICIDSEGFIVSTDGHRMFVGKADTDQDTTTISIKSKAPAKFDHVIISTDNKSAVFKDKDNVTLQSSPIQIIDGRFPDWRRVSKYKEGKVSAIGLNIQYIKDAAKAATFFNKKVARIDMQGAACAVHVKLSDDAFMVIMPARI